MNHYIRFFISIILAICCIGCAAPSNHDASSDALTTENTDITTEMENQQSTSQPAESVSSVESEPLQVQDAQKLPCCTLMESTDAGQTYQDKIIFVGDSTTHHMRNREVLPGGKNTIQVWTPTSGTLTLAYALTVKILNPETNTEMTIIDAAGLNKPEIIVITLGMNGISFMDEDSFKTVYTALIHGILEQSPDTKIILQSIFPRTLNGNENYASITQEMIDTGNIWVHDIAQECNVYYLDTQSVLKDENGYLRPEYSVGDGIHISRDGYLVILQYIRTHPIPGIS